VKRIFVDTNYWIATINPKDQWAQAVEECASDLGQAQLVTSLPVLIEVLNYFAGWGAASRRAAVDAVEAILEDPEVMVAGCALDDFVDGLRLYASREDQGYSLTDCISMNQMREHHVTDVLTTDTHFSQEGFNLLMRK